MKQFLVLLVCLLGISFSANAQTKFVVDLDGVRDNVISSRTYTIPQSQSILTNASYRGGCPRIIPVYVYVWNPGMGYYDYQYTSPFPIYCGDTMDDILDRIKQQFF